MENTFEFSVFFEKLKYFSLQLKAMWTCLNYLLLCLIAEKWLFFAETAGHISFLACLTKDERKAKREK